VLETSGSAGHRRPHSPGPEQLRETPEHETREKAKVGTPKAYQECTANIVSYILLSSYTAALTSMIQIGKKNFDTFTDKNKELDIILVRLGINDLYQGKGVC
jgi:hypothetical protein